MSDQRHDNEYVRDAIASIEEHEEEPKSIDDFVSQVLDNPQDACSSAEYLLRAIEHYGKRTVTEHGKEMERYRFFDDPENDGEHAILGHTRMLNEFVEDLRQQATGSANEEKIFWFEGATATGKSELKRCIINGLREFSKTDDGRRYTVEWNAKAPDDEQVRYVDGPGNQRNVETVDEDWFQSPVQSNPLTVLPEETRERIMTDAGIENASELSKVDMDPFSAEAVEILEQKYGHDPDAYDDIFSDDHLRVVRYTMDVGRGIGVLQSEDDGKPKHKLAGQWMSGMVKELDSRGRRNPQAFSYDGVLSQGNTGVSVIEDASHHFEMLTKMLNVVDDDVAKIDRRTQLPLDTVFVLISNPGLGEQLNRDRGGDDPLRALRRRMIRYDTSYLVTVSNEVELLYRLLTGENEVWGDFDEERIHQSVEVNDTELAPHTLYAVAMYEVVTRMKDEVPRSDMDRIDRSILYDTGSVEIEGVTYEFEDLTYSPEEEGDDGIPCTYTRDVLAELIAEEDVILPQEAVEAVANQLNSTAVFGDSDTQDMYKRQDEVCIHALEYQEDDVLDAMLRDRTVEEEEIEEYVEHVHCWGTDEDSVEPDPLKMKVFETEHLGMDESDYDGTEPTDVVEQFRRDEIITKTTTWLYEKADDDWEVDLQEFPVSEVPVLDDLLGENSWRDVASTYENFDPNQWAEPLEGTETEELKAKTIDNMQDMFGYSEESAQRTASHVIDAVKVMNLWD